MIKWIFTITYNFDVDYIAKCFDTERDALMEMYYMLEEEVEVIQRESEYEPSVLKWSDDDIVLVYDEDYSIYDPNWSQRDCAYYRIFKVEC